ncbi:DUF4097 domain-containing protein [Candidatus Woesearchaeota archaeon]|nr:DUF4097 domain-containing protein [Candidatus Woesearchaeota archaeon]
MLTSRLFPSLFIASLVALLLAVSARADESSSVVRFSQPGQPGIVKIQLAHGSLRIEGADSPDVVVKSTPASAPQATRKDGLRVLTSSSTFSVSEKDNVINLDASSEGWPHASSSFELTVPRQTSVIVQNSWGGDVVCSGLSGDIEVNGRNGSIRLEEVSGGIAVSTMSGAIQASVRELRDGKALSLQSMNGEIVLRLPEDAKANLRVRTQNGSVLTDFAETALVTKSESFGGQAALKTSLEHVGHGVLTPEARDAIREAARAGAEAVREAATAIREAAEAAREGAESARLNRPTPPAPPGAPRVPRPPKLVAFPTLTGGKLVTGSLNGGGTAVTIATMNGDVVLRRVAKN